VQHHSDARRSSLVGAAAVIIGIIAVTSCGGADEPQPHATSPSSTTVVDETTTLASTVPTQPPTTIATPASTRCSDKKGDSEGELDLVTVELEKSGDEMTATFVTDSAPPTSDTVLWSLSVASADGNDAAQLGVKILDGEEIGHFIFDFGSSDQRNLTDPVEFDGRRTVAAFPIDVIDALKPGGHWHAALNVDGTDVDFCPGGADTSPLDLTPIDFPSDW
jgi:hypothetical protein